MPQKKRAAGRRSEPKLFRCTGFGNCDMVFTRSEHLARHARKHTGEKPFRCVVPNCDRMFSRFDNMMQHTHTHNRQKKKDAVTPTNTTKEHSKKSNNAAHPYSINHHAMKHNGSSHSKIWMIDNNHRILPGPMRPFPVSYNNSQAPLSPSSSNKNPDEEGGYSRYPHYYTSSSSPYPSQPSTYNSSTPMYYTASNTPAPFRNHHEHQPSLPSLPPPLQTSNTTNTLSSSNPTTPPTSSANAYPYNSSSYMTDYFSSKPQRHHRQEQQKESFNENTITLLKHRLSYVDLSTPIQELGATTYRYSPALSADTTSNNRSSLTSTATTDTVDDASTSSNQSETSSQNETPSRFKSTGIDITPDEFEALQGFGKFCSEPVIREPMLMTRITTSPTSSITLPIKLPPLQPRRHSSSSGSSSSGSSSSESYRSNTISPTAVISNSATNLPSQIHAFRQHILTAHESYQRPVRHNHPSSKLISS